MKKHTAVLAAIVGTLSLSITSTASAACFENSAARAAHFRTLQQEFNVAALNCRSINPNDPSIAQRYNIFVRKYDSSLQGNAQILKAHFRSTGENLDRWMTRVANSAGQRVVTDPAYCQRASDILDQVLAMETNKIEDVAVETAAYRMDVPTCSGRAPTVTASTAPQKAADGTSVASARQR